MQATTAKILTSAEDGVAGYLVRPDAAGAFPGVMLVHHANGLTAEMKVYAAQLAAQGHAVLAPRLFEMLGVPGATHIGQGADLQKRFADADFLAALDAAWRRLCAAPFVLPAPRGVVGFSMGARLAIPFAADHPDVGALVLHYPSIRDAQTSALQPRHAFDLAGRLACATQVFAAGRDDVSPPAMQAALQQRLAAAGRPLDWQHVDQAGHGFMSPDMAAYDFDHATAATRLAAAFLARHLRPV